MVYVGPDYVIQAFIDFCKKIRGLDRLPIIAGKSIRLEEILFGQLEEWFCLPGLFFNLSPVVTHATAARPRARPLACQFVNGECEFLFGLRIVLVLIYFA